VGRNAFGFPPMSASTGKNSQRGERMELSAYRFFLKRVRLTGWSMVYILLFLCAKIDRRDYYSY
jgi:hypothetical protein